MEFEERKSIRGTAHLKNYCTGESTRFHFDYLPTFHALFSLADTKANSCRAGSMVTGFSGDPTAWSTKVNSVVDVFGASVWSRSVIKVTDFHGTKDFSRTAGWCVRSDVQRWFNAPKKWLWWPERSAIKGTESRNFNSISKTCHTVWRTYVSVPIGWSNDNALINFSYDFYLRLYYIIKWYLYNELTFYCL